MKNLDPLIRREFEKMGMNIVDNDALADLVISKVRRERIKLFLLGAFAVSIFSVLVILAFNLVRESNSGKPATSLSYSQKFESSEIQPLPQAGYQDVDTSRPASSSFGYTLKLNQGWVLQSITDNPSPIPGEIGKVNVYVKNGDSFELVQQYSMSARTQINEFGVPADGVYRIEYLFQIPNFQGRVRVAIVRSL